MSRQGSKDSASLIGIDSASAALKLGAPVAQGAMALNLRNSNNASADDSKGDGGGSSNALSSNASLDNDQAAPSALPSSAEIEAFDPASANWNNVPPVMVCAMLKLFKANEEEKRQRSRLQQLIDVQEMRRGKQEANLTKDLKEIRESVTAVETLAQENKRHRHRPHHDKSASIETQKGFKAADSESSVQARSSIRRSRTSHISTGTSRNSLAMDQSTSGSKEPNLPMRQTITGDNPVDVPPQDKRGSTQLKRGSSMLVADGGAMGSPEKPPGSEPDRSSPRSSLQKGLTQSSSAAFSNESPSDSDASFYKPGMTEEEKKDVEELGQRIKTLEAAVPPIVPQLTKHIEGIKRTLTEQVDKMESKVKDVFQRCNEDLSEEGIKLMVWQRLLTALPMYLQSVGVIERPDAAEAKKFFGSMTNAMQQQKDDKNAIDEQLQHFFELANVLDTRLENLEGEVLGIGDENQEEGEEEEEKLDEEENEEGELSRRIRIALEEDEEPMNKTKSGDELESLTRKRRESDEMGSLPMTNTVSREAMPDDMESPPDKGALEEETLVSVNMTLNADFQLLSADDKSELKGSIRDVMAESAGVDGAAVSVTLTPGSDSSVKVDAKIQTTDANSAESMQKSMNTNSMAVNVTGAAKSIPGVKAATTGELKVSGLEVKTEASAVEYGKCALEAEHEEKQSFERVKVSDSEVGNSTIAGAEGAIHDIAVDKDQEATASSILKGSRKSTASRGLGKRPSKQKSSDLPVSFAEDTGKDGNKPTSNQNDAAESISGKPSTQSQGLVERQVYDSGSDAADDSEADPPSRVSFKRMSDLRVENIQVSRKTSDASNSFPLESRVESKTRSEAEEDTFESPPQMTPTRKSVRISTKARQSTAGDSGGFRQSIAVNRQSIAGNRQSVAGNSFGLSDTGRRSSRMSMELDDWQTQYALRRVSTKNPTLPRQIYPMVEKEISKIWEALEKVRDGYQIVEENFNASEVSMLEFMDNTSSELQTCAGTLEKFDEHLKRFAENQVQFRLDLEAEHALHEQRHFEMALDAFREEYADIVTKIKQEFEKNANKIAAIFPRAMAEKEAVMDYNISQARYFAMETRIVACEEEMVQQKAAAKSLGSRTERPASSRRQRSRSPERTESPPPPIPEAYWDPSGPTRKFPAMDEAIPIPVPNPQPFPQAFQSRSSSRPSSAQRPPSSTRPSSAAARFVLRDLSSSKGRHQA